KLYGMKVWNNNQSMEPFLGVGARDVTIETSVDGTAWSVFGDVELARAPGEATYDGGPVIPMDGTVARYVRLNIHNNWGGILAQAGLSEVQFTYAPMMARYEKPASSSTNVSPDTQLSWRSGREAGQHQVYMGDDIGALTLVDTVTVPRYDLAAFDPQLGQTYYWRVDEVNDAEAPSLWAGPMWRLSTPSAIIVDDFEKYTNYSPNRPFQTWLDGYGYSADEFFPVKYPGNGTGAGVGHDIWGPASPYFDGNIMETLIAISGRQSLPFYYDNTGGASQTDRIWSTPQDWSKNGIQTLVINVYGDPNNTGGPVYAKINGKKVTYPETADFKLPVWHLWSIDLASLGIDLTAITSLSIGVEGSGSGMILIDDIGLYREAPSLITAWYSLENNTQDVSGNGHDGVAVGDPVYVTGTEGMGLLFNGSSQYVDLGSYDPSEGTGQLSVSLWAKWQGLNGGYQGLIGKRDTWAVNEMMWQIEANIDSGAVTFSRTESYPGSGNPVLPIGEWTHVGVSFNGTTARFYVNGLETGSGGFSFGTDPGATLQFGAVEANGGNAFNGTLDEVKLYNRPLSPGEMRLEAGLPLN
ncbi:MAG: LamG domain-containing protein, partial [Phycisphaerae bacterium]|nr:LamG domain-containing protein [Phycisphaerae bacterium]